MAANAQNRSLIRGMKKKVLNIHGNVMLDTLKALGDDALEYISDHNGRANSWNNITYNLEDSIGYAIYNNGKCLGTTMLNPVAKATEPRYYKKVEQWGSDITEEFFSSYTPPEKGYSLIVVAGMFYAEWLETLYELDVLTQAYQKNKDDCLNVFLSNKKKWTK